MTEQAITAEQFKEWVGACARAVRHTITYTHEVEVVDRVCRQLNVPEAWREPVRVMAQGGYYYGADSWMESAVGKTEQANTEAGHEA